MTETKLIAESPRVFDWLHNKNRKIGMPDVSDEDLAGRVRMLMRNDLDHEMIVCAARDRIMCLVKEKRELAERVKTLESELAELLGLLKWMNYRGGLGHDVHAKIDVMIAKLEGTQNVD